MRLLTFLSDFGRGSPYPAAMKAAAAARCDAFLLDISHDVPPGGIREGAYLLWSVVAACAPGTVHCAVIDPGVGTARAALAIVSGGQVFVGPDNGVLLPAARRLGSPAVYRLNDAGVWRQPVSATFHGRDVFAPAAAHLVSGTAVAAVGVLADSFVDLTFSPGRRDGATLIGEILWIDRFGNLVTSIPGDLLGGMLRGSGVIVETPSAGLPAAIARTFADVQPGQAAVLVGSDGVVEVAVNRGSAASRLAAVAGMGLKVRPA
ncbi:MAG TPA: SAM-dependent chlorinase/fluorinase [bacterium]|nr:SAM-dependent chlorinase/fluorinase [bacterium]